MTEALSENIRKERFRLFIVVALELICSLFAMLLLRNNVTFLLQSWFLFSIFLSVMLLRGSTLARIILVAAQFAGAYYGVLFTVMASVYAPRLVMFLMFLYGIPLVIIVLRRGGNRALTIFMGALALGFFGFVFWGFGLMLAGMLLLPVTNVVRAVLLIESIVRGVYRKSQTRRFTFIEAVTTVVIAAICMGAPILAEPAYAKFKVWSHLKRQYYWQDMVIVENRKDDKGFYMEVEHADDPTLRFSVTTGRGMADNIFDNYLSVIFYSKTPEHYDRLLKEFPIEKSTQANIIAPSIWGVYLQKDMTLEDINKRRHMEFRLDITLRGDDSSFEEKAPLIVKILETIREDFLSPETYVHHNGEHIYFRSIYVDKKISAARNLPLPTVEEVIELIKKVKSNVE